MSSSLTSKMCHMCLYEIIPECLFLLLKSLVWVYKCESNSVVSSSLQPRGLYNSWISPGENSGVGSRSLVQGIFPTQGSNPGLQHCSQIFLPTEPGGQPWESEVHINMPEGERILPWSLFNSYREKTAHSDSAGYACVNRGCLWWRWNAAAASLFLSFEVAGCSW